ncbi:MAG: glycosyltransferase, partial [Cetobacterium sp.]
MLTISIPTRNKDLLEYNLKEILKFTKDEKIEILICDNSEDDEIEKLYENFKKINSNIYYKRNLEEKNFDINCFNALNIPNTKYVWAIGDGLIIRKDKIKSILEILERDYDFIVFDHFDRI